MKDKGFTLVELLIVVAILAILAAIAIPQVGKYLLRSKIAALSSDLTHAYYSAQGYLLENDNATVSYEGSIIKHGFKKSPGIEVESINLSLHNGEIKFKHVGLDSSLTDTNIGTIDYNGIKTLPIIK